MAAPRPTSSRTDRSTAAASPDATCLARPSRSSANSLIRSVSAEPSALACARSDAIVQRRLRIVSTTRARDAAVGAAHHLGEILTAQLAAVGDRARDAEVGERAADAGAAQEVLAHRRGRGQPAVVREHLHRE